MRIQGQREIRDIEEPHLARLKAAADSLTPGCCRANPAVVIRLMELACRKTCSNSGRMQYRQVVIDRRPIQRHGDRTVKVISVTRDIEQTAGLRWYPVGSTSAHQNSSSAFKAAPGRGIRPSIIALQLCPGGTVHGGD